MVMRIEDQNMLCTEGTEGQLLVGKNEAEDEKKPWVGRIGSRSVLSRTLSVPEDCIISGIPSVTELDKLHRQRREEAETKGVSESGIAVHDAILASKVTMLDDLDSNMTVRNEVRGPKLRIRPQPFPSLHSLDESTSMTSPPIIPSSRRNNMLQPDHKNSQITCPQFFTSPYSDRFVLHLPQGSTRQEEYQDGNLGLDYDDDIELCNLSNNLLKQNQDFNLSTPVSTSMSPKSSFQKPSVARKQPIRLKPKYAHKLGQVDIRRGKSTSCLESLVSSSEFPDQLSDTSTNDPFSENLCLPKIGNSEMQLRLDVIQPRPVRLSSDKMHQINMLRQTGFPSSFTLTWNNSSASKTSIGSQVNRDVTPSEHMFDNRSLATSSIHSSSDPQLELRDISNETQTSEKSTLKEQQEKDEENMFSYASPTNVLHQAMTTPPKISIQNQLELAKSAARRFAGNYNDFQSEAAKGATAAGTLTSPVTSDPNFRTPPSKLERSSVLGYLCPGQVVPSRRTKACDLFLPNLGSFSNDENKQNGFRVKQQGALDRPLRVPYVQNNQNCTNDSTPSNQEQSTSMDMDD